MFIFRKTFKILFACFLGLIFIFSIIFYFNPIALTWFTSRLANHTVQTRREQFGKDVGQRLAPIFSKNKTSYPPEKVRLVFFKDEKALYLYAGNLNSELKLIKKYEVLAASGTAGPKLREGDHQVPEGLYKIESLNPNSRYHLSLRVNYPNDFDKEKARLEGRSRLGGDIMIHGKNVSIGCIAIGDENIEELFILAARSNYQNWDVIIAPTNLRINSRVKNEKTPSWIDEIDQKIKANLPE